ncbi:cas scaffolding protein family member 4-like isoform X2 [Narcine bancroftii]|uniref:cas scaffolding protein family member 4-like isoform X2 n=1 Tax=Narcine bancroftii TaxID=1343680 RepID=UPI0038312A39
MTWRWKMKFTNLMAKALYDNKAETPDELAFRKGDILTVIEQNIKGDEGWWRCSLHGQQGIVPGNRLQLFTGSQYDVPSLYPSPCSAWRRLSEQNIYQVPMKPHQNLPSSNIYQVPSRPHSYGQHYQVPAPPQQMSGNPAPARKYSMFQTEGERRLIQQMYDIPLSFERLRSATQSQMYDTLPRARLDRAASTYDIPAPVGTELPGRDSLPAPHRAARDGQEEWKMQRPVLYDVPMCRDEVASHWDCSHSPWPGPAQTLYHTPPTRLPATPNPQAKSPDIYDVPANFPKPALDPQAIYDLPRVTLQGRKGPTSASPIYDVPPQVSREPRNVQDSATSQHPAVIIPPPTIARHLAAPLATAQRPATINPSPATAQRPATINPSPATAQRPAAPPATAQRPAAPPATAQRPAAPPATAQRPAAPPATAQRPAAPPATAQRPAAPPATAQRPAAPPATAQRPAAPPATAQRPAAPPATAQRLAAPPATAQHPAAPPAIAAPSASPQEPATTAPNPPMAQEIQLGAEAAAATLGRLQEQVSNAVSSIMVFVSSRWREREHLQQHLEQVDVAAGHVISSLGTFLGFVRGVTMNARRLSDSNLQGRLRNQLQVVEDSQQVLLESSQALADSGWALDLLALSKPQATPDHLDRFVMVTRTVPDDVKRLVSIIIANSRLLFPKKQEEQSPQGAGEVQPRPCLLRKTSLGVIRHKAPVPTPPRKEPIAKPIPPTRTEDCNYVQLQRKEEFQRQEEKESTRQRESFKQEQLQLQMSEVKIRKPGDVSVKVSPEVIQSPAYSPELCKTYFTALQKAILSFTDIINGNPPADTLIKHSKVVIIIGQKLVDTLCQEPEQKNIHKEVLSRSNQFCGRMKKLAMATKNAVIQPNLSTMQEMKEQVAELRQQAEQLRLLLEKSAA